MKVTKLAAITAAVAAVGSAGAATTAVAAPAQAPAAQSTGLREFEGRVLSVNRSARTFRLRDSERGTITVKVTRNTRFERISCLAGLRAGQTNIEVDVRRSNGRWVASEVERSGGGGSHGGDDNGGDDNGGGRGRDHAEDD
jgi:uncharacterized membrane protein YgcG